MTTAGSGVAHGAGWPQHDERLGRADAQLSAIEQHRARRLAIDALDAIVTPGRYCLYRSQTLSFHRPIFADTVVVVRGRVLGKVDAGQVIRVDTRISDDRNALLVSGTALVKC
jgi:hypothetical protein